jgi:glutamate synthase domain-containing protein 1
MLSSKSFKGMLFGMPDAFMRAKAKEALGRDLPSKGDFAVGNIFFPPENPDVLKDCKAILERLTKQRGLEVVGWRPVPVNNSMLGQDPLDSEPDTEQVSV